MRWTVQRKLSIIFAMMIVLMIGMSFAGIASTYNLNQNTETITKDVIPKMDKINTLEKSMQNVLGLTQRHILSTNPTFEASYVVQIDDEQKKVGETIASYQELLKGKSEISQIDMVNKEWDSFVKVTNEIIELSGNNLDEEAVTKSYDAIVFMNEINEKLKVLSDLHHEELNLFEKEGDKSYENVLLALSIGTLIALLIAILGIQFLLRTIQKPIVTLSESFKKMATGDLSIEPLAINSNDEIGQLATDFNSMLTHLRTLMTDLHQHIDTVAATSTALSISAEETMLASEQITDSIIDVSEGATVQLDSARSSNIIVDEIAQGMDQAAASIQKVSEMAVSTTDFTKKGTLMMETTVEKMDDIQRSTEMTADVVETLHKKSVEIGKIVSIITKIAGQTNLLALNASIEAARAGEHGKGFAVVASEVGGLAADSGSAANSIRHLIEEIQQEVAQAISAMETSKAFVAEGLILVRQSGESFHGISTMVNEVSTQAVEISAISEEINASTHTMRQLVDEVAAMSERADASAQDIVAAAEEQNATMQEITASSTVLSSMADTLKEMISVFKIK